jgi:hypothetical protein
VTQADQSDANSYLSDPLIHRTVECLYQEAKEFHQDLSSARGDAVAQQTFEWVFHTRLLAIVLQYDQGRKQQVESLNARLLACEMTRPLLFVFPADTTLKEMTGHAPVSSPD